MVNEQILIRDKHRGKKIFLKFSIIFLLIVLLILIIFAAGYFLRGPKIEIVLDNPIKAIIFENTNDATGQVNQEAVIEQAIIEFNEDYINYILVGMGVNNLHSMIGYGNPIIEFSIDDETWTSEVDNGNLLTEKTTSNKEDLRVTLSKEEAVNAILSSNIENFMKESVTEGNTEIEMIAGKVELGSKGYLGMYKQITGEDASIEDEEISIEDVEINVLKACNTDDDCKYDCTIGCANTNVPPTYPELLCGVFCCKCIENECTQKNNSDCGF